MEKVLKSQIDPNLRALVVWEPMLPTDWSEPGFTALGRVSDRRAQQFWDPQHLVAVALAQREKDKPGVPEPHCCQTRGFYWDDALIYIQPSPWHQAPVPVFWDGPVLYQIPGIKKLLNNR